MRIWKEEVLGPIMCVIKVPGDNDDVCVQMVNDCPFGLGSSFYSASNARALAIGSVQMKAPDCQTHICYDRC
jgi:acyl-CoA reductase-like NAD-dependent aldehyde dehydrogenase